MKRLLTAALSLLLLSRTCGATAAEIIPAGRLADWRPGVTVGVPGGIPTDRKNLIDVTKAPYNADNSGAADAEPAIMKAIAAAKDRDVVHLPAGKYRIDKPIYTGNKGRITIRGAGPDKTLILPHAPCNCAINIGSGGADWWYPQRLRLDITGSAKRGASVLTFADTKALDQHRNGGIGEPCQVSLKNDPALPVVAPVHFEYLRKQVTRIVAKTRTTVTISPALLFDLPQSLSPRLAPAGLYAESVGIEDLGVDGTNAGMAGIKLDTGYGCWLKNVTVRNVTNYHIWVSDSLQCEVRHCCISTRRGAGTNGAGFLVGSSSFCLFEDNILAEQFPHVEVNLSSGNVFAYNFCYDSTIFGSLGCSIDSNHGGHGSFNLYEGNYAANLQCDGYHGSASDDTVFRNWFTGVSPGAKGHWTLCLNRFTRNYSLVGNVLGFKGVSPGGYSFGNPNMGNGEHTGTAQPSQGKYWADWEKMLASELGKGPGPSGFQELDLDVEATTFRKGNFHYKDNGVPADESLGGAALPKSLYLKERPAWFGDLKWPPFGPDADFENNKIPAQVRFEAMEKMGSVPGKK